jgi:hypothetical protein
LKSYCSDKKLAQKKMPPKKERKKNNKKNTGSNFSDSKTSVQTGTRRLLIPNKLKYPPSTGR